MKEIEEMGIRILSIKSEHIIKTAELPFHHRDPFDRLIISQAMLEKHIVVTTDKEFSKYDIDILW